MGLLSYRKDTEVVWKKWLIAGAIFLTVAILAAWLIYYEIDRQVWITFCDVGQGDGVLIRQGRMEIVIDGGQANGRMVDCVASQLPPWDRKLELVVATHPDADHLGGLVQLLEAYQVDRVVTNGEVGDSELAVRFQTLAQEYQQTVGLGDLIRVGDLELETLWPRPLNAQVLGGSQPVADRNDVSLVFNFSYGDFDLLVTGDAGLAVEDEWRVSPVEVLKVSHHGSRTGTSTELLERAQPQLAVISVGKNSYGHPDQGVLERLENALIQVARTDQDGAIKIITDGTSWRMVGH